MFPECRRCLAVATVTLGTVLILHCPIDTKKHKCPYLPENQHTHEEINLGPRFAQTGVTVASTADTFVHPRTLHVIDDPDRNGSKLYVINVRPESA